MRNSRVPHEQCQPHPAVYLWGGGGGGGGQPHDNTVEPHLFWNPVWINEVS